jgi:hypothetical protein
MQLYSLCTFKVNVLTYSTSSVYISHCGEGWVRKVDNLVVQSILSHSQAYIC